MGLPPKLNHIQFLRWGGLSPVIQKGFNPEMPTVHSPPARRGLYAFPAGCIERFLLSGQNRQHKNEKPRRFSHQGPLWHHLDHPRTRAHQLNERGGWVLSHFEDYLEALRKQLHNMRSTTFNRIGFEFDKTPQKNFQVSTLKGWSKDHLEVFIERIIP